MLEEVSSHHLGSTLTLERADAKRGALKMRYHVHGKFLHTGIPVEFSISLNALTRESAVVFVNDLFQGPYAVPVINVVINDVDCDGHDLELRGVTS